MSDSKSSGDGRTRNWSCVVYPESAPEAWRDVLDELHIQWIESPLHDLDVDPTGELKKPHWHIVLLFDGPKSYDQVKGLLVPLRCPIPQRCQSVRGSVRYMAHLDNPEKHQYSMSDIVAHGGVDVADLLRPSSGERYSMIRDMITYVRDNGIMEFQDLMDYAASQCFDTWFPLLCDNSAYVVAQYIKSQRHRFAPEDGGYRAKQP